jgi:U3 small nucleolar RNA-associated protein 7
LLSETDADYAIEQIQPDMISLDPEFIGSMAPPTKLTTAVDGKIDLPFARLPRMERLRVQGKADETEDVAMNGEDENVGHAATSRAEKEKKKMRGKNKSLKRYEHGCVRALSVGSFH